MDYEMTLKKSIFLILCLTMQLRTYDTQPRIYEREYILPTIPVLFAILQEYNAPLTYWYVMNMAEHQVTADMLFSSLDTELPGGPQKRTFRACLTLAILQKSMPCVPQSARVPHYFSTPIKKKKKKPTQLF
jgi:hypothetical protein